MTSSSGKRAPAGLGAGGRALWRSITADWQLDPDERAILEAACRTADEIDTLQRALDGAAAVVVGSTGQPRANPLFEEIRRHRETLRRLLGELRIPTGQAAGAAVSDGMRSIASARWKGRSRGAS